MAQTPISVPDYFQRMLPRLGHAEVAAAANERELVELCRKQKPDLIIADVRMPEMDRLCRAARLKNSRLWRHIVGVPTLIIVLGSTLTPSSMRLHFFPDKTHRSWLSISLRHDARVTASECDE